MFLRVKVLCFLLVLSIIEARPADDSDYTLDEAVVPLAMVESRFDFDDEDEDDIEDAALEQGKYFQGDIMLYDDQKEILDKLASDNSSLGTRTGIISEEYRWPKDRFGLVRVPFEFWRNSRYCETLKRKSSTKIT